MKTCITILILLVAASVQGQMGIGTTTPTSTLDIRGSLALNYRAFTASNTAASTDNTLMFTGTAAATLTLPDAATCTGREYIIKKYKYNTFRACSYYCNNISSNNR
ncbi:MAG: hypothetical protein WKF35_09750 [Ferruginibacter sp.]